MSFLLVVLTSNSLSFFCFFFLAIFFFYFCNHSHSLPLDRCSAMLAAPSLSSRTRWVLVVPYTPLKAISLLVTFFLLFSFFLLLLSPSSLPYQPNTHFTHVLLQPLYSYTLYSCTSVPLHSCNVRSFGSTSTIYWWTWMLRGATEGRGVVAVAVIPPNRANDGRRGDTSDNHCLLTTELLPSLTVPPAVVVGVVGFRPVMSPRPPGAAQVQGLALALPPPPPPSAVSLNGSALTAAGASTPPPPHTHPTPPTHTP